MYANVVVVVFASADYFIEMPMLYLMNDVEIRMNEMNN